MSMYVDPKGKQTEQQILAYIFDGAPLDCAECNQPIDSEYVNTRNGQILCDDCYEKEEGVNKDEKMY